MSEQSADAARPDSIAVADTLQKALRCLARKGAYAVQGVDGTVGPPPHYSVHAGSTQVLALIPAHLIQDARTRGWIAADARGALRLAVAGTKALRCGDRTLAARPDPDRKKTLARALRDKSTAGRASARSQEAPLEWLRRRHHGGEPRMTDAQYQAGVRLALDYRRAQLGQKITSDWSGLPPDGRTRRGAPGAGIDVSDAVVAAREGLNRAHAAVGAEHFGILFTICCLEIGLEAAERAAGWPRRSGKVLLLRALTALARHYGLIAPERPLFARLQHWAMPTIGRRLRDGCNAAASAADAQCQAASARVRASERMRSTIEKKPLERCGVMCSLRPSSANRAPASVARMSLAVRS
jgi:Domain of unknown function (DUF6456)